MTKTEVVTDVVAVGAIVSPWWLQTLQALHDWAAWSLPVLGAAWLLLQAFVLLHKTYWKKP